MLCLYWSKLFLFSVATLALFLAHARNHGTRVNAEVFVSSAKTHHF